MRATPFFMLPSLLACSVLASGACSSADPSLDKTNRPAMDVDEEQRIDAAGARGTPLFTYEEAGDELWYWAPGSVRIIVQDDRGATRCDSELRDHGNMWTGQDVERAFLDDAVQSSLRLTKAPYSSEREAKLSADGALLVWARECDKCLLQPAGIVHLQDVLHTVLRNRRLLCRG